MACELIGTNIIACGPSKTMPTWRRNGHCPLCKRGRRLVTSYDGYYYGTTTYCLACNGREQEGDWRPPMDGDRYADENRRYIASLWDRGTTRQQFQAAIAVHERSYRDWEDASDD